MNPEREALKRKHRELFSSLSKLLFEVDPVRISFESNTDEYDPEVGTILPRLQAANSSEDVHTVAYEEILRWFGKETASPKEAYVALQIVSGSCGARSIGHQGAIDPVVGLLPQTAASINRL